MVNHYLLFILEMDRRVHSLLLGDTNLLEDRIRVNVRIKCQVKNCQKQAVPNQPFCENHVAILKDTDEMSDMKDRIATSKTEICPLLGANLILR